jgi:hypothetical protein
MKKNCKNRLHVEEGDVWTEYTGTREDLIAGGIATPDMFPKGRKQVSSHFGETLTENWIVSRLREERFIVTLMHDRDVGRDPSRPWNPVAFKDKLLRHTAGAFDYMVLQAAAGDVEKEKFGRVTHKLSEKDRQRLLALREQALHIIRQARVERGERYLRIVDADK